MRNVLILSTALLLASVPSACGQAGQTAEVPATDPQPEDPPVVEPAAALPDPMATRIADLPRSIVVDDDVIKADIRFDEAVFSFAPAIAMDVVEDARIRLDAMTADAEAYKQADPTYFRPYGLKIDWRVTGAAGTLVGLEGFQYTFTGGAHGNYLTDGRIYNALTGDQLRIGLLFTDQEAAATALSGTVYKAIADAKVSRSGKSDGYQMFLGESKDAISVSDILSGNISLIASTEDGKLGGFVLHYAPYEIGSYAEGSYHVTIPQADFHEFLKPEYQSLFAGEPADIDRADD
jgi:hypothetical protein